MECGFIYVVYPDMRSHTKASLSSDHSTLLSISRNQKIVTKSYIEAEFVGVNDAITFVMWTQYFCQEQVKLLPENFKVKKLGINNIIE